MRHRRAIHVHERPPTDVPPLTLAAALELLVLPALFGGLWAAASLLGAVPWWVIVGFAVYGGIAVVALGAALWRPTSQK